MTSPLPPDTLAQIYALLAYAFANPADFDFSDLAGAAEKLANQLDNHQGHELIADLRGLAQALRETPPEEALLTYTRISIGEDACKLNLADNEPNPFNAPHKMADVGGFYSAFGFALASNGRERPDYIGVELEFMRILCSKLSQAERAGRVADAEICSDAGREFVREHLGRYAPDLAKQLLRAGEGTYIGALGRLLASFVNHELNAYARPGVSAG